MKKNLIYLLSLILLVSSLSACDKTDTNDGEKDSQSNESITDTSSESSSETESESETEAPVSSGKFTFTSASDIKKADQKGLAAIPSLPVTKMESSAAVTSLGFTISADTEFYGHDSAINRDFVQYGWKYTQFTINYPLTDFYAGEFTGDRFTDLLTYSDGNLTVYKSIPNRSNVREVSRVKFDDSETILFPLSLDATLRGTGDFNSDSFSDALLIGKDGTIYIAYGSADGFDVKSYGKTSCDAKNIYSGDVNGDGFADIVVIEGFEVTVLLFDGKNFTETAPVKLGFENEYYAAAVGDINADRKADIILVEKDAKGKYLLRTLFSRENGLFGPTKDEHGNKNLYAEMPLVRHEPLHVTVGDINGDRVGDMIICNKKSETETTIVGLATNDEPAYDYSVFGMKMDDGTYRMYAGGRWFDQSDIMAKSSKGSKIGDGDHVMAYTSKDGINWNRYIERPTFYLGCELGNYTDWWVSDTLEPEVVYVDGKYHMFIQSYGIEPTWYDDQIGYATSEDGIIFERKTDTPVILPSKDKTYKEFDEHIGFNHEEVIYVPDDPDGKCWWMYTGHLIDNKFNGYVRLRSSDPTCFYWDERENTNGISYIGNQIGYISDFDGCGNRLFLRITYHTYSDRDGSRNVPTLQASLDGLTWTATGIDFACVDVTDVTAERNKNAFFLGFTTLNGTGEIEKVGEDTYELYYFATTCSDSVAPDIFYSEAGVGKATIKLGY